MSSPSTPSDTLAGEPGALPPARPAYIWSLNLRDLVFIAIIAALCMLSKLMLRIPIHIPGHSGVLWVALFIVCRGIVNKRGTGILLGIVAGVLATFMHFGGDAAFEWMKWVAAGIALDVLVVVIPGDLRGFFKAALVGVGVHLAKLAGLIAAGLILRVPFAVLFLGLGWTATTHAVFGAIGGLLAAVLLRELRKVPMLDAGARGG
jgi:hypothetical protein